MFESRFGLSYLAALCTNAQARVLDDPQASLEGLALKQRQNLGNRAECRVLVLPMKSQNNQTRGFARRVGGDVREIQVRGNEFPIFLLTHRDDCGIRSS